MPKRLLLLLLVLTLLAIILIPASLPIRNSFSNIMQIGSQAVNPEQKNLPACNTASNIFPEQSLESDGPIPQEVKNSFKSTIGITVRLISKDSLGLFSFSEPIEYSGSGFMVEKGIFISARHIFFSGMIENQRILPFSINNNGLPVSNSYYYEFCGLADINGKPFNFPLELIKMGDPYKLQDFAAFKGYNVPPELKPLEFEKNVNLGDTAYSSGRIPVFKPYGTDIGPIKKSGPMDFISYTFTGSISAIIPNWPNNKDRQLEKLYRIIRIHNNPEPGYSGGPVFDKNGRVIGMTITLSQGMNFSHAISAEDLSLFMRKIRK